MSYATPEQFIEKYGQGLAVKLTNPDAPSATTVDELRLQAELERASDLMDGYLRVAYGANMPFEVQPRDLDWRCMAIALYMLTRYPTEEDSRRYAEQIQWLRDISAGRAHLAFNQNTEPVVDSSVSLFQEFEPTFTSEVLSGY